MQTQKIDALNKKMAKMQVRASVNSSTEKKAGAVYTNRSGSIEESTTNRSKRSYGSASGKKASADKKNGNRGLDIENMKKALVD